MKKAVSVMFIVVLVVLVGGFAYADDVVETRIYSLASDNYFELGIEVNSKIYDDENKRMERFFSLSFSRNFIINVEKDIRFIPVIEMAGHYGLAEYEKLGFSVQSGFGIDFFNFFHDKRGGFKLEPFLGIGTLPVNYRPKLNFGTILGFRIGVYIGNFGVTMGIKEYLIEGDDINSIITGGIKWSFR